MIIIIRYVSACKAMGEPNLNANEVKVLAALASRSGDFSFTGFKRVMRLTRLDRKTVRRCCRSLTRKGLAKFARGLWTEDGEPAGSGYAATEAGEQRADAKRVDKIALREWY